MLQGIRQPNIGHLPNYQYPPFRDSQHEIRILEVLPGSFDEHVVLDLRTTRFDKQKPPAYEALSYAWGTEPRTQQVRIITGSYIAVTAHLEAALKYLRSQSSPRILWIDALCIDQENDAEKGHQVAIMGDIYESATRVLVWLGIETVQSNVAMTYLQGIASKVEVDWAYRVRPKVIQTEVESPWTDSLGPLDMEAGIARSLMLFLGYSWFNRLWILQEVGLADQNAVQLQCGTDVLSWLDFRAAIFAMQQRNITADLTVKEQAQLRQGLSVAQRLFYVQRGNGVGILALGRQSLCSDPKDRVYGLLGLVEKAEGRLNIVPRYRKTYPLSQVYKDLVLKLYAGTQRLDILTIMEQQHALHSGDVSWAMTSARCTNALLDQLADGWTPAAAVEVQNGRLRVSGIRVTAIRSTEDVNDQSHMNPQQRAREMARLLPNRDVAIADLYPSGGTVWDASCCILVGGSVAEVSPYVHNMPLERIKRCVEHCIGVGRGTEDQTPAESDLAMDLQHFFSRHLEACENRSVLTCDGGYLGLGPCRAKPGDEIVVFLGCKQPMVVRAVENGYRVIGEAYVHGLEHGAALFGSLPTGWTREFSDDFAKPTYIDSSSGKATTFDPRLRRFTRFGRRHRTKRPGSLPVRSWLTVEHLKRCGVPVVDIDLV